MNVIFLDIDGVMNHRKFFERSKLHKYQEFCPVAVECLKKIISKTNSKIVLSSTWRRGYKNIQEAKDQLFKFYDLEEYLVGFTPVLNDEIRGKEIQLYIDTVKGDPLLNVENFIIIDDESDMGDLLYRLVYCSDYSGLNKTRMKEAIHLMSGGKQGKSFQKQMDRYKIKHDKWLEELETI